MAQRLPVSVHTAAIAAGAGAKVEIDIVRTIIMIGIIEDHRVVAVEAAVAAVTVASIEIITEIEIDMKIEIETTTEKDRIATEIAMIETAAMIAMTEIENVIAIEIITVESEIDHGLQKVTTREIPSAAIRAPHLNSNPHLNQLSTLISFYPKNGKARFPANMFWFYRARQQSKLLDFPLSLSLFDVITS